MTQDSPNTRNLSAEDDMRAVQVIARLIEQRDLARDRSLDLTQPLARLRDCCDRAQARAADLAAQVTAAERLHDVLIETLEAYGGER